MSIGLVIVVTISQAPAAPAADETRMVARVQGVAIARFWREDGLTLIKNGQISEVLITT